MSNNTNIVRSITAEGSLTTDFDWVSFSITITGDGDSSPEAKVATREDVDAVNAVIDSLKKNHSVVIDPDTFRLSFNVAPKMVYANNANTHAGYIATYDISFRTKNLSLAGLIMDKLTEVKTAQVNAPHFHHDNPDAVYEQVFEKALANAEKKFSEECRVLGIDETGFQIDSWQVHDGQRGGMHGKMAAMAEMSLASAAGAPPVELDAGKAQISVSLTLNYIASHSSSMVRNVATQPGQGNGATSVKSTVAQP